MKELKDECKITIDSAMVAVKANKIPKWKAAEPDLVQGYWIKKL